MRALDLLVLARDNKADGIRAAVASGVPVDISNDVSIPHEQFAYKLWKYYPQLCP